MPNLPLSSLSEATPDWLTATLRHNGFITQGAVAQVESNTDRSANAHTATLRLTYTDDATGALPCRLFLKLCGRETVTQFGDSEVRCYTDIVPLTPDAPLPICYDAAFSEREGRYHLLLEDLSETHENNWGVPPSYERAAGTVEAIARLHAPWWDSPKLADTVGRYPTAEVIGRYIGAVTQGLEPMLAETQADLSDTERETIRRIFARHPARLVERAAQGHLTCIHGDLNNGNILSPRAPGGRTYLIDRQPFTWSLTTWVGVSDLAYMMVHWWEPELRRAVEKPLLEYYQAQLQARGVSGYAWERLWYDYRLTAMQSLYVVGAWCADETERRDFRWVWWPQLQKTLTAIEDLRCLELL